MAGNKTVIVTGASQGIGAAVVQAFLDRGYNVVATSRSVSKAGFAPSPNLALVDGDIGQAATAANIAQTAISKFGSIDTLVNNAGTFLIVKPFMDYTAEDFRSLVSTNLEGFFLITQLAVKQMLSQGTGGSVTSLTASLAQRPPHRWSSGFDFNAHQERAECDYHRALRESLAGVEASQACGRCSSRVTLEHAQLAALRPREASTAIGRAARLTGFKLLCALLPGMRSRCRFAT
jgi:NAD(P)-dependent dehydrogenase (short-subunit alcohol dehydrogenase family)